MPLPQFSALLDDDRLSEDQRDFLVRLGDLLTTEKPALLDLEGVSARVVGKRRTTAHIDVDVPNHGDPDLELGLAVEPAAVVVSYGWYDHIHFGYGEPEPPVEEAFEFIRDMLRGNIEVEITYGWLWTKVETYRLDRSTGERISIHSVITLSLMAEGFRWPPRPPELRRLSFT